MSTAIKLRNIVKRYTRGHEFLSVLDHFNLEIPAGSFAALTGPSGTGKTTILNLIGGLDRADQGEIQIGKERLDRLSERALARWRSRHIGFIFQADNLLPMLSAAENVELPLLLTSLSASARRTKVAALLDAVGLGNRAAHKPGELSGGQQQRVGIARALAADAPVLLCDEPTGSLDAANADAVLDLLQAANRERGTTIVMVTHDPKAAGKAGQRVVLSPGGT